MSEIKGAKLFVNLGASQARRRLKGFGHGVRKVQTAGRNQAVIIHTATGRHLNELEAKFRDVGFSSAASEVNSAGMAENEVRDLTALGNSAVLSQPAGLFFIRAGPTKSQIVRAAPLASAGQANPKASA